MTVSICRLLKGNLGLDRTSLYSSNISELYKGVIKPAKTAFNTITGLDVLSLENSEDTTTFVSMTANSLLPSSIARFFYLGINLVKTHFGDAGLCNGCTHGSKSFQRFLPFLSFGFGTNLNRNPTLANDSFHEDVEGCGGADTEVFTKNVEVLL